ncbi:MAG: tyrosine-type recombinase/integrase [Steroidobacteraceae bacterium]
MSLTVTEINKAKPGKHFDGGGLFLLVKPTGSKLWRFKYRFNGIEKLLALGSYPEVPLAEARSRHSDARALLSKEPPIDPGAERAAAKVATGNTFAAVAEDYLNTQADRLAPRTLSKARWQLREFLNPHIGETPIDQVTAPKLLAALRRIEARGLTETPHKTMELAGRVFMYGIASGLCERNIAADLKLALKPRPTEHLAAITDPAKVGELLRAIESYEGQPATRAALRLLPHIFLRQGELRDGRWSEVDFEAAVWRIPGERMKMGREHLVPLSDQALAILKDLKKITGGGELIFPAIGPKHRPISNNTLGYALQGLGYGPDVMVPHGFRSMASTLLHELGWDSRDIELQLAHADSNKIRGIYNRAERIKERTKMMQAWSDYLDNLRDAGNVVALRRRKA